MSKPFCKGLGYIHQIFLAVLNGFRLNATKVFKLNFVSSIIAFICFQMLLTVVLLSRCFDLIGLLTKKDYVLFLINNLIGQSFARLPGSFRCSDQCRVSANIFFLKQNIYCLAP